MYSDYLNVKNQRFEVSDAPSTNLTVDASTIKVTANGTELTAGADSDYTLVEGTPTNGFTVKLNNASAHSGQAIVVTYDAKVNSVTEDAITNKATVTFSNNPTVADPVETGTVTTDKSTNLYVTRVPIEKIAFNNANNNANTLLKGATFSVKDSTGAKLSFIYDSDKNIYSVVPAGYKDADGNAAVQEITVNDATKNTAVTIAGLGGDSSKISTYTFTETKAPEGYLLGSSPVSFTMSIEPTVQVGTKDTDPKVIEGVTFRMTPGTGFDQFLDKSDNTISATDPVEVKTPTETLDDGTAKTTVFKSGMVRVENTKNADDFAKTGGEIVRVIIAVAVLMAIGAAFLIASHLRRRSLSR